MNVRIKTRTKEDREHLVIGLTFSGYKTWVEEVGNFSQISDYYVLFEEDELERTTALGTYQKSEK